MNEIITNTVEVKFSNPTLAKATTAIIRLGETAKRNLYEIAHIIAGVDETECYKDDGFNTVHEWTMKTFGFKKSTSYTLLKVGKEYTRENILTDKNGKKKGVIYGSNLIPENTTTDFTTTQIECMLPIGEHDEIETVVESGQITPEMSCKEIKAVVKKMKGKDESAESESETPESETPESETPESETEIVVSIIAYIRNGERFVEIDGSPMITQEDIANAITRLNLFLNIK